MSNPTIGFIGYGNMAQAIAEGLVAAGAIDGTDIVACAAHYDKLEKTTAKVGATPLRTAAEVADAADVVIIAIKPYQIESVIKPIAGALANESTFVVSIAAGWDLAKYRELFGADFGAMHIQCTIPNTPMAVGKGVLVTETDNTLTAGQTEVFERLFSSISLIERVDSAHMGIGMCIAGCALHRHVHRGAWRCWREVWFATRHRLPSGGEDGGGRGCSVSGERNPSRCHEGRRLLAGRHHHQGCGLIGGERVPRCCDQSRRRHRSLILS